VPQPIYWVAALFALGAKVDISARGTKRVNNWFAPRPRFVDFPMALVQLKVQQNVDDVDGINRAQGSEKRRPLVNKTYLRVPYNAGYFVSI
jgi:hypothetical protein